MACCGRIPLCGRACVSHRTGKRTTPSAAACCAFQAFITSVAASRSSVRSDGEAMKTRKTCALNVMGFLRNGRKRQPNGGVSNLDLNLNSLLFVDCEASGHLK